MTNRAQRKHGARSGYSLVEVTLALLVVAIGLTATFALFPEGLRTTRAAVDDMEIGFFAEYVFTSLDLAAGKYGGIYPQGWSIADTQDFKSLSFSDRDTTQLDDGEGNVFYWIPEDYDVDGDGNFDDAKLAGFKASAFTYSLAMGPCASKDLSGSGGVPTYAVLKVWPGEYPPGITPQGEPRVFYREILPLR